MYFFFLNSFPVYFSFGFSNINPVNSPMCHFIWMKEIKVLFSPMNPHSLIIPASDSCHLLYFSYPLLFLGSQDRSPLFLIVSSLLSFWESDQTLGFHKVLAAGNGHMHMILLHFPTHCHYFNVRLRILHV